MSDSIWGAAYDAVLKSTFDETEHPRQPAGSERGGEFAPKADGVSSGQGAVKTTVAVAIKYSNRTYERYYDVSADMDFTSLKNEIKGTGARFTGDTIAGYRNTWHLRSKADLDALKSKYGLKSSDVRRGPFGAKDIYIAGRLAMGEPPAFTKDRAAWDENFDSIFAGAQDAYNKSDEAFVKFALAHGERPNNSVIMDMLKKHIEESWAKEIIEAERNK